MTSPSASVGEAPGRLDFLGGVADYSGALVLQTPTRATTRVGVRRIPDDAFRCSSGDRPRFEMKMGHIREILNKAPEWGDARTSLDELRVPGWVRYPLGCFLVFCRSQHWWPDAGLEIEVQSTVPQSQGVSSSAALEIATLRAFTRFSGIEVPELRLAHLGQEAENQIAGAPCGLMDQLASAMGVRGKLLPILCRPDFLGELVPIPSGIRVFGLGSGVRHAVSDSPYASARTATFMGKRILERKLGDVRGYLTEFPGDVIRDVVGDFLPVGLLGADFLREYEGVDDALSILDRTRVYPVRSATSFAIEEHARCVRGVELLKAASGVERANALRELGEAMDKSHLGYSGMGLGSDATDRISAQLRRIGASGGVYGARISGGGSGGTVVVLAEEDTFNLFYKTGKGLPGGAVNLVE